MAKWAILGTAAVLVCGLAVGVPRYAQYRQDRTAVGKARSELWQVYTGYHEGLPVAPRAALSKLDLLDVKLDGIRPPATRFASLRPECRLIAEAVHQGRGCVASKKVQTPNTASADMGYEIDPELLTRFSVSYARQEQQWRSTMRRLGR